MTPASNGGTTPETLARRKIREAVEAKGRTLVELEWEPIGAAAEKEGPSGGWFGTARAPSGGEDYIMGYRWQDVIAWIDAYIKADKTSPAGVYP